MYWKWSFMIDLLIKDGDFPVRYVSLPEGTVYESYGSGMKGSCWPWNGPTVWSSWWNGPVLLEPPAFEPSIWIYDNSHPPYIKQPQKRVPSIKCLRFCFHYTMVSGGCWTWFGKAILGMCQGLPMRSPTTEWRMVRFRSTTQRRWPRHFGLLAMTRGSCVIDEKKRPIAKDSPLMCRCIHIYIYIVYIYTCIYIHM